MASTTPLKDLISNTALGDMEKILSKDPFPTIRIQYDAFLTGYCYLKMLHYLESFNSSPGALVDFYLNK